MHVTLGIKEVAAGRFLGRRGLLCPSPGAPCQTGRGDLRAGEPQGWRVRPPSVSSLALLGRIMDRRAAHVEVTKEEG